MASLGIGAGVRLGWESNGWPGAGYVLYYGGVSRTYTNAVDTGSARTNVVRGLKAGSDYFFAVTAYDPGTRMESDFSAETKVAMPIALGSNVVWTVATAPTVTGTWARVYGPVTNGATNLAGFVRLMVERK